MRYIIDATAVVRLWLVCLHVVPKMAWTVEKTASVGVFPRSPGTSNTTTYRRIVMT